MKILTVCQYYHPEDFQVTPICEQLAADGHQVTVLTGLPNYPTGVIPQEYKTGRRDEVVNGVRVIRCHEIGRKKGAIPLALNYFSFVLSASRMVKRLDPDFDLVFVYQLSPVLMGLPAIKYVKKHPAPLYLYCCDLWPESMKMYIRGEGNPAFRWAKRISRKIYRAADRVACQSAHFLPYLKNTHGVADDKMIYLPAFGDDAYLTQDFSPPDDRADFVFLGNLGIAQNLIDVLQAVEKIKDAPNFRVHFVGDGVMLPKMRKFAADHGLEDLVVFHGRKPKEDMPDYYRLADACLVSLKEDNLTGLSLPIKVQGYMAAGKPILGMIGGATAEAVHAARCGACVAAGDVDGLAALLRDFIEHREKYQRCGENARAYFQENYGKARFMEKLEEELERVGEAYRPR